MAQDLIDMAEHIIESGAAGEMIYMVCEEANTRFFQCGSPADFCLQAVTNGTIVFGGLNRVMWNPVSGWKISATHCSKRFIEKWNELYTAN